MSQHITLPSDSSMMYYPDNTVAHYSTKLPERIHLDGEYEVGLAEIIYPHSWYNVDNRNRRYWFSVFQQGTAYGRFFVKSGYYANEVTFATELTKQVAEAYDQVTDFSIQFLYDEKATKIIIHIDSKTDIYRLVLSSDLKNFLGFDRYIGIEPEITADRVFELNAGLALMYVYCDIAAYTIVGDTKAPLLRVCHVTGKHGDNIQISYDQPHYVPLSCRDFDTIEININTERGRPMPFEFGKSVVTLHLRRKHEKTLLL